MEELTIGEVARRAGIRPSALRYYESIGLMPQPRRVSGRRRYDERTLQLLKIVQLAQAAGFTIAEVQTLLHGFTPDTPPAARWQPLASRKIRELDARIVHAQQMKQILAAGLNCGCLRLEDCAILLEGGARKRNDRYGEDRHTYHRCYVPPASPRWLTRARTSLPLANSVWVRVVPDSVR